MSVVERFFFSVFLGRKKMEEKDILPIYLFNLLLVGDFQTGKTSFFIRYNEKRFYEQDLLHFVVGTEFVSLKKSLL